MIKRERDAARRWQRPRSGMTDSGPIASLAVQRRRESGAEEAAEQRKFVALMAEHLNPACTYWTSLENKPRSARAGFLQKLCGVKSGLPDVVVIQQQPGGKLVVFVELKSRRGVASKTQKQARAEMLPAGVVWYMARSASAAMKALHLAGLEFCRPWEPPPLEPWEGPFTDPHQRLPQEPSVRAERRAAQRRWRERQRARRAAVAVAMSVPAAAETAGPRAAHARARRG